MTTLYRKWRPQTFAEVRGQERVVRTLQNSLSSGRIGHAYLFTGPRGVGKTTTARLLAKALNCLHDNGLSEQAGIANAVLPDPYAPGEPIPVEPDNSCWVCREITAGSSLDVIEIDAASNGRVDDVRELRSAVNSGTNASRYKFYILDEVHQMTKDAFDALLKTFEEPPPRVVFVLATTDPNKVPPTILSRCQRFDFRRISVADIRASLADICVAENIQAEPAALEVLARAADGSSRDSQSLLDQAIAFCGSSLTLEGVRGMLGLASAETIDRLVEALLEGQTAAGLELINQASDAGVDPRGLNRELVERLRALLLLKVNATTAATLDVAPEALPDLQRQAQDIGAGGLVRQIKIFTEADYGFRTALQAQLPLELAFLQAVEAAREQAMPAATPARGEAPALPKARPPFSFGVRDESGAARGTVAQAASPPPRIPAEPPAKQDAPVTAPPEPVSAAATPEPEQVAESEAYAGPEPPRELAVNDSRESYKAGALSLDRLVDEWPRVRQLIRAQSRTVEALIVDCRPVALEGATVTLGCPGEFHVKKIVDQPDNKRMIEAALSEVAGSPCYVKCVVREKKTDAPPTVSDGHETAKPDENDPLLRAALRMLSAHGLEKS